MISPSPHRDAPRVAQGHRGQRQNAQPRAKANEPGAAPWRVGQDAVDIGFNLSLHRHLQE